MKTNRLKAHFEAEAVEQAVREELRGLNGLLTATLRLALIARLGSELASRLTIDLNPGVTEITLAPEPIRFPNPNGELL